MSEMKTMESQFERAFRQKISELVPGVGKDYGALDLAARERLLRFLLELACRSQGSEAIAQGRGGVLEMPRVWVLENVNRVAEEALDLEDAYEFRRLGELLLMLDPDLARELADRGMHDTDDEVAEAARDLKRSLDAVPEMEELPLAGDETPPVQSTEFR